MTGNGGGPLPLAKPAAGWSHVAGKRHGQAFLGRISSADVADAICHADFRARLRSAFDAAAAEVGDQKALKAATSAAKIGAEAYARLSDRQYGNVPPAAAQAVMEMLGR